MRWEVFCRVVDNFGDIGFAWRLAADLAARGEAVRFVVDDASALAWMAGDGTAGVEVAAWPGGGEGWADVGVETFGCGLPVRQQPWRVAINVEHLSAEGYVERSHGLPSMRSDGRGEAATTWCFYPGFTTRTGGLLREPDLIERLDADAANGPDGERRVLVFSYAADAFTELLAALAPAPAEILACPGGAIAAARAALGPGLRRGNVQATALPFVSQAEFDTRLARSSLNFVRGEDSLVRAIWAGQPFVWQLYAQADGAHQAKLEAFLDRFLADADAALAGPVRALFRRWNGWSTAPLALPPLEPWRRHCRQWRAGLAHHTDLTTALLGFAATHR